MKLLKCKLCNGEVDVVNNDRSVNRKVKCRKCGSGTEQEKGPEVMVIRRRTPQ
jgi:DNA replicative helicase MCM subunit Mcm2 (Cdc46/Mcm family)